MKVYTKEQISALLEKAASEIEERDAEIARLQAELDELKKQNTVDSMITKEASFDDSGWFNGDNTVLGEPSYVSEHSQNAKEKLESFLANLV